MKKRRTVIHIRRPASFNGWGQDTPYDETWQVTVEQVRRRPWRPSYEVLGVLVAQHIPRQYDTQKGVWIEPHDRVIPGVCVPAKAEVFEALGPARKRARSLADTLSGQLHPTWEETST